MNSLCLFCNIFTFIHLLPFVFMALCRQECLQRVSFPLYVSRTHNCDRTCTYPWPSCRQNLQNSIWSNVRSMHECCLQGIVRPFSRKQQFDLRYKYQQKHKRAFTNTFSCRRTAVTATGQVVISVLDLDTSGVACLECRCSPALGFLSIFPSSSIMPHLYLSPFLSLSLFPHLLLCNALPSLLQLSLLDRSSLPRQFATGPRPTHPQVICPLFKKKNKKNHPSCCRLTHIVVF